MIELISTIAKQVGVSAHLLISICTVESGLRNVDNLNDGISGSFGYCQVSPAAAKDVLGFSDIKLLRTKEINVLAAALYLKSKIKKYGYVEGIAAYNSGSPRYKDGTLVNKSYVDKVLKVKEKLKKK